jgi:hypothetical protein
MMPIRYTLPFDQEVSVKLLGPALAAVPATNILQSDKSL